MELTYEFINIDNLYKNHHYELLVDDKLRPCKSVTRDVENTINKFIALFKEKNQSRFSETEALKALALTDVNDTFNTNIRTMKELGLLVKNGDGSFAFSDSFMELVNNGLGAGELVLNKLYSISSFGDLSMYLNSLLCTLREGYKEGSILGFPDSNEKFIRSVPKKEDRMAYRNRVFEYYGFSGRYKEIDDSYTPNANYRVLTELKKLNLIAQEETSGDLLKYSLTTNGLHLLRAINENIRKTGDDSSVVQQITINQKTGYNKIFYGIPGCGKSWRIENDELKNVDKKNDVFRTTFFLDYSNSDFVGQIYPEVDGDKVKYEYVPGPFTKALERALTVEDGHMIYLVIEEINRGNAAAIFGDLFQLLDRLGKEKDGRVKGDSEYPISNTFIEGYFKKNGVPFEKGNIYIPHNLTLLATMNTSDQNVYPLDTAFQRRWDREKVVSKLNGSKYAALYVPGTKYTWEQFASSINTCMIDGCKDGSVTEDKNLGAYFATEEMLCTREENERNDDEGKDIRHMKAIRFANNVLEYLFGTAVKFSPEILFDKEYKRYQQVYDNVDKYSYVISDNSSDDKKSEWFIKMLSDIVKEKIEKNSSPASFEDGE